MDERYRPIYEAIYTRRIAAPLGDEDQAGYVWQFRLAPPDARFGRTIDTAISRAEERLGASLREDAKALLAVNFSDLVVLPLVAGGSDLQELQRDVRTDIAMLVSEATAEQDRGRSEITGHSIIDSLNRNWGNLRVSRFNLWED
jgi:hypothetical protein